MRKRADLIIIGAGASALFLASKLNRPALILEQNEKIGKKLLISGGGKCNISNEKISVQNYLCDDYELLDGVLKDFTYKQNLANFRGLEFKKIRNNQFFAPNSKLVLERLLAKNKSEILCNTKVLDIEKKDDFFLITTNRGEFSANRVVISSGAISFSELGTSEIALQIANKFGINFTPFSPALVPLTLQSEQAFFKQLSGISLNVKINEMPTASLLFTHKALSGPAILSASLFHQKGKMKIDFLPDKNIEFSSKKELASTHDLPKKFAAAFCSHIGVAQKPLNRFTADEKEKLKRLKSYEFAPAGTQGFSKAEICKGGVHLSELTPFFEAKKCPNLFFIGECTNASGCLGGYNIHYAFASANRLAKHLNSL